MPSFDADQLECRVFTFKEGALSALAHDLELRVTKLRLVLTERPAAEPAASAPTPDAPSYDITASFDARSLVVLHAVDKAGRPTDQLSAADRRKIEHTIVSDVLDARRHPEIQYQGTALPTADGFSITGELVLEGKRRPLALAARTQAGRIAAEATIHQPDFGIRPFSAMLGALKIRPDVKVRISMTWPLAPA